MTTNPHPFTTPYADRDAAELLGATQLYVPLELADAAEVNNSDLSLQFAGIKLRSTRAVYHRDNEDLRPDDGVNVLHSADGTHWIKGAAGNGASSETIYYVSSFSSIADALTEIGSDAATLVIDIPQTLTDDTAFPATLSIRVENGGVIDCDGFDLTINGTFSAGLYQIFSDFSSSEITFSAATALPGFPEWWGAVVNDAGVDNSAAINASIVACPVTQLQAASYYYSDPIVIRGDVKALLGAPLAFPGAAPTTTLIQTSASETKLSIGPSSWTGTAQNTAHVRDINFTRSVAPSIASGAEGIRLQYTVWPTIENVLLIDDIVGVHMIGLNQSRLNRVFTSRRTAGVGPGTDKFYGFWLDAATDIGFAGGSASTYMTECAAASAVTWTSDIDYQGLLAIGTYGYSDLYINRFETSNLGFGMTFGGNNNSSGTIDNKNTDVQINNVILDACHQAGIQFVQTSLYGSISVLGGFISTQDDSYGFIYNSSLSAITVSGVNILMGYASGTNTAAVVAANSKNITMVGNSVTDPKSVAGVYQISGTTDSRFEDRITCNSLTNGNAAIVISSSSARNYFGMSVQGKASAFSVGYYNPDDTTTASEFNCTGLDAAACAAGKLYYNGGAISSFGVFGTSNLASGVI